jgi:hypothetical protein
MPRKPKTTRYNNGIIRATEYGTFRAEINHDLQRLRKSFDTEGEARAWIDVTQITLNNETQPLGALDYRDAAAALRELPEGVTLLESARYYAANHVEHTMTVSDAIKVCARSRTGLGISKRGWAKSPSIWSLRAP